MIIDNKPQHPVEMSHDMETTTFVIEQSAKAFVVLSSKLYKDKAKSIVRELSCNARDAHVDAGTTNIAFDVHLPSPMEPEFWIRDYGTGLSGNHIKTVYTRYFKSTKENNNDAVGCLGLGSKSPFAYTQSFMVTSWFSGVKTIYSVFINDRSEPAMAKMFEMATDEPNGIEVRFNVPNQDQNQFETACADVFRWFDTVRPNFVGRTCSASGIVQTNLSTLAITKRSSHSHSGTTQASVIMAGVEYPIDTNNPEVKKLKNLNSLLAAIRAGYNVNVTISAFVDMGAIDFTPSREELEYTKKTLNAINQAFVNVKRELETILPELKEDDFSGITFAAAIEKINAFLTRRKQASEDTGILESVFQQDKEIDALLNKKFGIYEMISPYIIKVAARTKTYGTDKKMVSVLDIGQKSGYVNLSDKNLFVIQDVTGIDFTDFIKIYPDQIPVFVFEKTFKSPGISTIVKDSSAKEVFEKLGFKCILASTLLDFKLKDRKYSSIYRCNFANDRTKELTTLSFSTAKNKDFLDECTVPVFYMALANKRPLVDEYWAKLLLRLALVSGFKCEIVGVYMPTKVDLQKAKNFNKHFAKELDFWMQSSINRNVFVFSEMKKVSNLVNTIKYSRFKENILWAAQQAGHSQSSEQYTTIEKLQNEIAHSQVTGIGFYNKSEFWKNQETQKHFPMSFNKAANICNFDIKQLELQSRVHECLSNIRQVAPMNQQEQSPVFDEMVKAVYNFISFNKT